MRFALGFALLGCALVGFVALVGALLGLLPGPTGAVVGLVALALGWRAAEHLDRVEGR